MLLKIISENISRAKHLQILDQPLQTPEEYRSLEEKVLKNEKPVISFQEIEKYFKKEKFKIISPEEYVFPIVVKPQNPNKDFHIAERNASTIKLLIDYCRREKLLHFLKDIWKDLKLESEILENFYSGKGWFAYHLEEYIYHQMIQKTRNPELSMQVGFSFVQHSPEVFKIIPNRFLALITARLSNQEVSQISHTTAHFYKRSISGQSYGFICIRYNKLNRRIGITPALYVKGLILGMAAAKQDRDIKIQVIPAVGHHPSGKPFDVYFLVFSYQDSRGLLGNIGYVTRKIIPIVKSLRAVKRQKEIDALNSHSRFLLDEEESAISQNKIDEISSKNIFWEDMMVSGINIPTAQYSGDHLWTKKTNKFINLGLFDAQGHGRKAARYISNVFTDGDLSTLVNFNDPALTNLKHFDRIAQKFSEKFGKLSAALVQINAEGSVNYASAAIPVILQYVHESKKLIALSSGGRDLGFDMRDDLFVSGQTELMPGDFLFIASDGLSDLKNSNDDSYELDRIGTIFRNHYGRSADDIRNLIIKDIRQFAQSETYQDDLSFILAYRLDPLVKAKQYLRKHCFLDALKIFESQQIHLLSPHQKTFYYRYYLETLRKLNLHEKVVVLAKTAYELIGLDDVVIANVILSLIALGKHEESKQLFKKLKSSKHFSKVLIQKISNIMEE